MKKFWLGSLVLLISLLILLVTRSGPRPVLAACVEGEWGSRTATKGESWKGDYGACAGGRLRCHSRCWDGWTTYCEGGVWKDKWISGSGCNYNYVCRSDTGSTGISCNCCPSAPPPPPPPAKNHKECRKLACVSVAGEARDQCAKDRDCFHKACVGLACKKVSGKDQDLCSQDSNCWHLKCEDKVCQKLPSASQSQDPPDLCQLGNDEPCWHFACVPGVALCEKLPTSAGDSDSDECQIPEDCPGIACNCEWEDKGCGDGTLCARTEKVLQRRCDPLGCAPPDTDCQADPNCVVIPPTSSWFQTARGDVAAGGLSVNIPDDATFFSSAFDKPGYNGPYFSVGEPVGAVLVGSSEVDFGSGGVSADSARQWLAEGYSLSSKLGNYNFSFFQTNWKYRSLTGGIFTLTDGKIGSLALADLAPGEAVLVDGSLTVADDRGLAGVGAMILVSGSLNFTGDFAPLDSAIFFVAQGAVSFGPAVKNVRAAILTDAQIGVVAANPIPTEGLLLEGMYLANSDAGELILERKRVDNKAPVVMFAYSPEIIVKLTESFGRSRVLSWREVIGGKP